MIELTLLSREVRCDGIVGKELLRSGLGELPYIVANSLERRIVYGGYGLELSPKIAQVSGIYQRAGDEKEAALK